MRESEKSRMTSQFLACTTGCLGVLIRETSKLKDEVCEFGRRYVVLQIPLRTPGEPYP